MVERVWGKEEAKDDQYEGVCGPEQHREVCRESSEQRGLFQGWCCAAAGSLPVLLLWDSRRGGMHQGPTAGWEGQHPLYPHCVPRITVWLCLGPWRHSILVSGTQLPLSQSRVSATQQAVLWSLSLCPGCK